VTVAGKPSGTQATKTEMAKLSVRETLLLFTGKPIPKKIPAERRAIVAIIFTNLAIYGRK
jgi:hypothetical protein